jgi:hypothetical protein
VRPKVINVQWVHKAINLMKMALPEEEFIEWCGRVASYRKPSITSYIGNLV